MRGISSVSLRLCSLQVFVAAYVPSAPLTDAATHVESSRSACMRRFALSYQLHSAQHSCPHNILQLLLPPKEH